jgi:long-chain acyl-CoA synthetase
MSRPHPWERSYPPGTRWDAPLVATTLPSLLDRAVATFGPRPALDYHGRKVTYAELGVAAGRAAAGFLALGIGRGDGIALYLPNTPDHPTAFFGALRTGAHVVHLSPLEAERELAHKLNDSGTRTIVTTNHPSLLKSALKLRESGHVDRLIVADQSDWGLSTDPLPGIPHDALDLADLLRAEPLAVWPALAPEDLALLQYTGGTTGTPKGAMLTHANLTSAVASYDVWTSGQGYLRPGEERVVGVLPLFHIYALTTVLLRHLNNGSEILLRLRFDAEALLRDIETCRATIMLGVPTMYIALSSHPDITRRDLSSLRVCTSGGAGLPVEVEERFRRLTGLRIGGGWGMTETAPAGTNLPLGGAVKAGSIGLPLPGIVMDVVALDDPRRVLPPGETGELRVRGPNVMRAYWKRPEETGSAFVDGFFLTGDIGRMDEDGWFFLVDRKKDMILSGGFNVYPRVIEEAVYEHADVEEAVVIGIPDAHRGQSAKAFVKLRSGAALLTLDGLRAFLADKVGRHEMPVALEIRAELPRTVVGKLSKKALNEEEARKRSEIGES